MPISAAQRPLMTRNSVWYAPWDSRIRSSFCAIIALSNFSVPSCISLRKASLPSCISLRKASLPVCISLRKASLPVCISLRKASLPVCISLRRASLLTCISLRSSTWPLLGLGPQLFDLSFDPFEPFVDFVEALVDLVEAPVHIGAQIVKTVVCPALPQSLHASRLGENFARVGHGSVTFRHADGCLNTWPQLSAQTKASKAPNQAAPSSSRRAPESFAIVASRTAERAPASPARIARMPSSQASMRSRRSQASAAPAVGRGG